LAEFQAPVGSQVSGLICQFHPPPLPDDQNFFETPLWNDLRWVQSNHLTVWRDKPGQTRLSRRLDPRGPAQRRQLGQSQGTDLAAWQAFYRSSNNLFSAKSGRLPTTSPWPRAPDPGGRRPARVEPLRRNRQLLIATAAALRPVSGSNYDDGVGVLLPIWRA